MNNRDVVVGVVTVTYNSAEVIGGFLRSLTSQSHRQWILFVVDNASADNTLQRINSCKEDRIRIISNSDNRGVAAGNNQGINAAIAAACDAVLLINNDTEFEQDLITKLVSGLEEYRCDMTTPKMLYFEDPQRIWCAGGGFNPLKGYFGFHSGEGEVDVGQYDEVRRVEHTPTCCLLIRTNVFDIIGLMDERYFVYIDDADFCFRAWRARVKMMYLPRARLLHKVSALTGGAESKFSILQCARNHIYFMLKNLNVFAAMGFLVAWQIRTTWKLGTRRISFQGWVLRESAFFQGLRLWGDRLFLENQAVVVKEVK